MSLISYSFPILSLESNAMTTIILCACIFIVLFYLFLYYNHTRTQISINTTQCRITGLSLKLNMIKNKQQILMKTYKNDTISSNSTSYVIADLIPGYEYSLEPTLKTSTGNWTLRLYKFTLKFTGKYLSTNIRLYIFIL